MPTAEAPGTVRPKRWDSPFDPTLTSAAIARAMKWEPADLSEEALVNTLARILASPVFEEVDSSRFPRHLPLSGILLNDARLLVKEKDEIIVREGDYGNSAFVILKGSVRVFVDKLPRKMLGRAQSRKTGLLASLVKGLRRQPAPETRPHHTKRFEDNEGDSSDTRVFLQDVPRLIKSHGINILEAGELFGEIAALGRSPRTATVVAGDEGVEILEIRWQGLRDLMNFAPGFRNHIEDRFRRYGLSTLLLGHEMIRRLDANAVEELVNGTRFERHGKFDWYGTYQQMLSKQNPAERLQNEPLIINESDYINGLMIVRGGFVRVSRHHHQGETTVSYLGTGQSYGLAELWHNFSNRGDVTTCRHSLRAIGYVDLLVIPTPLVEKHILPHLTPEEVASFAPGQGEIEQTAHEGDPRDRLGPGLLEFLMDKRTINGSRTMLIDLDRCTRCDDCVRACASTHDGNPRFIRYGDHEHNVQVAQSCMHCHDPICMIPCPTGAIHREDTGEVVINDDTCIGCSACADNCPYQNIQMVQIRDPEGKPQFPTAPSLQGSDLTSEGIIRRATKCDLCYNRIGGPACVQACPHDALQRFDMQDINSVAKWLSR